MDRNLFFFLDETGILNRKTQRFFALGTLMCPRPQDLYNLIQKLRDRTGFYDEIKWRGLSTKNFPLIEQVVDIFVENKASFSCLVLDRERMDYWKYFKNDFWRVYESFTVHLIRGSLPRGKRLVLLADFYPTPAKIDFEDGVRKRVNGYYKREAVFGVCRIDSKSNDILQLTDLLLGAVVYEYKLSNKLIAKPSKLKRGILSYIKKTLDIKDFTKEVRNEKVRVMEFKREVRQ